jgi:hypothetical protein
MEEVICEKLIVAQFNKEIHVYYWNHQSTLLWAR